MTIATGTHLGSYEILAPIGSGGMGEVYRAHDNKLGRDVAIKALPESFTHDPDRLSRFQREAKMLASLNHPNIEAIYGLEEDAAFIHVALVVGLILLVLHFTRGRTAKRDLPLPAGGSVPVTFNPNPTLALYDEKGQLRAIRQVSGHRVHGITGSLIAGTPACGSLYSE